MSRINKTFLSLRLSLLSLVILFSNHSYAQELLPKEPIVVNGDKVEYFHDKKQVVGMGNISITYKDVLLTCDRITVYLDTKEAIAEGNVKVTQKGAYFTGERMNYNFETKSGTVLDGYLNARPFYGMAKDVDKIAQKDQFKLNTGYVTTCDYEHPHYRLESKQIMIYLKDKVVAKHIFFYVGNVPIFYFPYYVQTLKETKSHITVIPGQSKDWGYYALTAYRYHIDDNNAGDILLDYRTKKGLAVGLNHYYYTKEVGEGALKFYFTRENEFVYEKMAEPIDRYRWQVRHKWDMGGNTDTYMVMEFNKLSDRNVIKDYLYNEYEELGYSPDTYISFITQKKDYSTEFLIRKRVDKFYDVVERIPEYSINIPSYRLFKELPVYYQANASSVYLNHAFDNTNAAEPQKDLNVVRADTYNRLSYVTKLFRALSVTPYGAVEDTYYSRNRWGNTNLVRNAFSAGVDTSIKFYKIYDIQSNLWGLDINKLRHIITPTANYFYIHQPTISPDNLNQFDSIDNLQTQNGIALGIENRLQTKRLEGEQMKSVDLATLRINTTYMCRLEGNKWHLDRGKFQNIYFDLELVPYPWAYLQSTWSVNTKKYNIESESIDLVAHWKEKWALAISHRYEDVETGKSNLITLDATYKINEKWKVRAYERFNALDGFLEEQEYSIYRDLHCWTAELVYDIQNFQDMSLWIVLRVKAFPEYPIGFKRTYSRPRFGNVRD
jgi:LPS-assembly protein